MTVSQSTGSANSSATIELPDKTYFKIGEVAKLLEVEPYVLRYWETEFDVLEPGKTKSGQRVYQRSDIELLFQIRSLLYEEMFTIAGARRQLARSREGKPSYFDLGEGVPRRSGTAVADEGEVREQLAAARQELTTAQTELAKVEEALAQSRDQAGQRREQIEALKSQLAEAKNGPAQDEQALSRLQARVAELQEQVAQHKDREDTRKQRQKEWRQRRQRQRRILGTLRQEVESLAVVAAVESPKVGR